MEEQHHVKRCLIVILLLGCVHLAAPVRLKEPLTNEERKGFLIAHNSFRKDASKEFEGAKQPPASRMKRMYWNAGLEAEALAYTTRLANGEAKGHGFTPIRDLAEVAKMLNTKEVKSFGQSIAGGIENPSVAVRAWYRETKQYTLSTNKCTGTTCLHYTQLMWTNTFYVGCGIGVPGKNPTVITCDYFPGGNMYGGPPYKEGETCSLCAGNQTQDTFTVCDDGLCQPQDKCSPVTECKVVDMENCLCSEADYNATVNRLVKGNGPRLAPSSLLLLWTSIVVGLLVSPLDIA